MSAKHLLRNAAHTIVNGGLGFLPMPVRCRAYAEQALTVLARLEKYRQALGIAFDGSKWGYEIDDKSQYNKGLSQWRPDERKTVFQYSPLTPQTLLEQGAPIDAWKRFFTPCEYIFSACFDLGLAVAREIDAVMPGYGLADSCLQAGPEKQYLRFLAYQPRTAGNRETATAHQDRALLTIHVYESAPGLYIGHDKETKIRVGVPQGQVAVFAGRKAAQMTNGKLVALWHGTEEVPELEPGGRLSAVFFLHSDVPLLRRSGELL